MNCVRSIVEGDNSVRLRWSPAAFVSSESVTRLEVQAERAELELFARFNGHALAQQHDIAPLDDHAVFSGRYFDLDWLTDRRE